MHSHSTAAATRRQILAAGAAAATAAVAAAAGSSGIARAAAAETSTASAGAGGTTASNLMPFHFALNTSTIRGQNLPLEKEFEIAAQAGYEGIEPWVPKIHDFVKGGGSLKDLAKRAKDLNLVIPSTIGFAEWIVDDDARRAKGVEQMKRDMEAVAQVGGLRIAAPASGANRNDSPHIDLRRAAERYRAICEIGHDLGVAPTCEVWGFSPNLTTLADATYVVMASGHPDASVLPDVYHLYKGGSPVSGLRQLNGKQFHNMHVNDYPAAPPREQIGDAQRIYPGDGVAPLGEIFRTLRDIGYTGFLSLELFSEMLWKRDALKVAKDGLEKTRAAVQKALA